MPMRLISRARMHRIDVSRQQDGRPEEWKGPVKSSKSRFEKSRREVPTEAREEPQQWTFTQR